MKNEFEAVFSEFVAEFGGEVLPEPSDAKIADYLFRQQNIIAELKCLMCDQSEEMNKKVTRVVQDWVRKHKKLPPGYDGTFLDLRHVRVIYYDMRDPFWGEKLIEKVAENILSALQKPSEAILFPEKK